MTIRVSQLRFHATLAIIGFFIALAIAPVLARLWIFPAMTGDPPLFVPSTPQILLAIKDLHSSFTLNGLLVYDSATGLMTVTHLPENHWIILEIPNRHFRPVWLWSEGNTVQFTITTNDPVLVYIYLKER